MPALFEKRVKPGLRVAVWEIKETEQELLKLLPPLRTEEKTFLERISFGPRKLEWLASRALIFQQTGIYPASRYKDNGQPFLTECNEKISISHTRGFAATALSTEETPGIDIEYPSPRIEKVSERFLHSNESNFIAASNLRQHQLGLIWCLKEAIFKQVGIPGLNFKDQIITHPFNPETREGKITASVQISENQKRTITLNYIIHEDFYLTWTE